MKEYDLDLKRHLKRARFKDLKGHDVEESKGFGHVLGPLKGFLFDLIST